jgi:uncharacterized protein
MRWLGGREGGNVEDRRGMGGMAAGGGIGVAILSIIAYFAFGINPNATQQVVGQLDGNGESQHGTVGDPADSAGKFVDIIATNVDDVWATKIKGYTPPKVVLYEEGTETGCGFGDAAAGPFYCAADATVYLDLSFWRQMQTQLGASGADFARAYVIAHEIGHHVQTMTGASRRADQARAAGGPDANRASVALELQADCYAGVWAANASAASGGHVALEAGDMAQGLKTANAIGDDAIQRRVTGKVSPEQFTHGTSAQRVTWLERGYTAGDPAVCDTFVGN